MEFKSLDELSKYLGSPNGFDSIIDQSNVRQILINAAHMLEDYLKEELQNYFDSYQPKEYVRTGNTVNSIRVSEPYKSGVGWSIEIYFDESLALHDSVIGNNQPKGYTPWLLEVGWNIENKVGFSRPMFTSHPGTHYIKHAVEKFNRDNQYGLEVHVYHGDDKYI